MFQILRNTFLTFYRRESRQEILLDEDTQKLEEAGGEPEVPSITTALDLERALGELPEAFRSVLLLADLEGFPPTEIANIMDLPVGTVKSRLFRARRLVRRRLGDYRPG